MDGVMIAFGAVIVIMAFVIQWRTNERDQWQAYSKVQEEWIDDIFDALIRQVPTEDVEAILRKRP